MKHKIDIERSIFIFQNASNVRPIPNKKNSSPKQLSDKRESGKSINIFFNSKYHNLETQLEDYLINSE